MDQLTPTARAVAGARSLLAGIDHAGRRRLDAEVRLALVSEVVALGRQVEALRAILIAEAGRSKAALSGEVSVAQARSIDRVLGELPATLTARAAG